MPQETFKNKEHNMLANIRNTVLKIALSSVFSLCGTSYADEEAAIEQRSISAIGTLCPLYKSTLGSVVSGKVDRIFVEVGDSVSKGQPLLALDQDFFAIAVAEANAAVRAAQVEIEDASRNYERMKKLFEKPEGQQPSISQKRYEDAKTRYDQAQIGIIKAEEMLKKAQKNLSEATIIAPYDGVVTKRLIHPGEPVNAAPATKLLEMLSIDDVYVEFSVPQIHMSDVTIGTTLLLAVEGTAFDRVPASINRIYPDIDEKTRSVKCRALVKNTDRKIHPGALARVYIPLKSELAVSSQGVSSDDADGNLKEASSASL
jgi:membrane fusion protein, multidrug efflux system